jgi:ketosteroid isomerase-like protein
LVAEPRALNRSRSLCGSAVVVLLIASCAHSPEAANDDASVAATRAELVAAQELYQAALRATDVAAMAGCFAQDAELLEPGIPPIRTRAAIKEFLGSFPGVRVEVATANVETVEVFGDVAFLWGSFFERLAFPGQPVSEQRGSFVTEWRRTADGLWSIRRLWRIPVETKAP